MIRSQITGRWVQETIDRVERLKERLDTVADNSIKKLTIKRDEIWEDEFMNK